MPLRETRPTCRRRRRLPLLDLPNQPSFEPSQFTGEQPSAATLSPLPKCCHNRPVGAIDHLHNLVSMLDVVTGIKIPQGNQTFGVPNQRVLEESENLVDSIEEIGFKFPFITNQVSVDGSAKSHEMFLVFNENGLKKLKLKKPFVMQEFVNHGGVIFKVYVVGDHVLISGEGEGE
ncbi:inositol-tetrakisphosphate 1-kinase 1 [Quercus suber]|uniref:inositol-tetrakisphosphate 1-kinase 1 n=1 Tax=Quercus suber TaxID=58331 RepID=UPI0032E04656